MAKMVYSRDEEIIRLFADDGSLYEFECRCDFVEGENDAGEPHESLPIGEYTAVAEEPGGTANGTPYGTFYIETGDSRERDIHGGGSGLSDPFAPYQGWVPTYGCLRMQNADGEELSRLMIDAGNHIPLTVQQEDWTPEE